MTVTRVRSVNLWYIMTRVKSLYIISLVHKELTHIFQGDSGGPLYKFDEASRRAILGSLMFRSFLFCIFYETVGVVNRGEGCAREDGLGIYARIKVQAYIIGLENHL